jgi:hypothetical protein
MTLRDKIAKLASVLDKYNNEEDFGPYQIGVMIVIHPDDSKSYFAFTRGDNEDHMDNWRMSQPCRSEDQALLTFERDMREEVRDIAVNQVMGGGR